MILTVKRKGNNMVKSGLVKRIGEDLGRIVPLKIHLASLASVRGDPLDSWRKGLCAWNTLPVKSGAFMIYLPDALSGLRWLLPSATEKYVLMAKDASRKSPSWGTEKKDQIRETWRTIRKERCLFSSGVYRTFPVGRGQQAYGRHIHVFGKPQRHSNLPLFLLTTLISHVDWWKVKNKLSWRVGLLTTLNEMVSVSRNWLCRYFVNVQLSRWAKTCSDMVFVERWAVFAAEFCTNYESLEKHHVMDNS